MSFVHLLNEIKNKKAIIEEIDHLFRIVAILFITLQSSHTKTIATCEKLSIYFFALFLPFAPTPWHKPGI